MGLTVFYLTTEPPFPAISGGRVRSLAQLRVLCSLPEVSRVVVQHLREDADDAAARDAFEREHAKIAVLTPVVHPIHVRQHLGIVPKILGLRSLGVPYLAGKWASSTLAGKLRAELPSLAPEVIWVDHLGMMQHAPTLKKAVPGARLVLEQHNVESDFFLQRARQKRSPADVIYAAEWLAAKRFEAEAMRRADAVVAISPLDAKAFRELAQVRATVVPQLVPLGTRRSDVPEGDLLYVGNLGWHPNVAGLDWFFERVWPLLRQKAPALRLRIAGSGLEAGPDGTPHVPDAWRHDGVEVLGFVPDLAPLYATSSVVVAPILGGSGVRIKLLEAMRAGLPLVTTAEAVDGTEAVAGVHLAAHDDPQAFAAAVLHLAVDPAARVQLRDAAYDFLAHHHGMELAARRVREALGLVDGAATGARLAGVD